MSIETARTKILRWFTSDILSVVTAVATLIIAIVTIFTTVSFQGPADYQTSMTLEHKINKTPALSAIETKLKEVDAISRRVDAITKLPQGTKTADQIDQLNKQIKDLNDRLTSLERYLLESPDKALALPLFQKELDSLKDSVRSARINTNSEIARIYDQNKWFIGLMFTMAVSVLGLAISNLYQGRKTDDSKE